MKTKEQIAQRIAEHEQQIVWEAERRDSAMAEVSKNIAKSVNNPEYVGKWLETWMDGVRFANERIAELKDTIAILQWTLED